VQESVFDEDSYQELFADSDMDGSGFIEKQEMVKFVKTFADLE